MTTKTSIHEKCAAFVMIVKFIYNAVTSMDIPLTETEMAVNDMYTITWSVDFMIH